MVALAVAGVVLAMLAAVVVQHDDEPTAVRKRPSEQAAATSGQPAPPSRRRTRPSPRRAVEGFARSYLRYLDGRASAAQMSRATPGAVADAVRVGRLPRELRAGPLRLSGATPTDHGASPETFTVQARNDRHRFFVTLKLQYGEDGWRVVELVPPDFASVGTPSAREPLPPAGAVSAARLFARRYLAYQSGARRGPPGGPTIRRQIATGNDGLAGSGLQRARVVRVELGPEQDDTVTATVTVSSGHAFTLLLERHRERWRASTFIAEAR